MRLIHCFIKGVSGFGRGPGKIPRDNIRMNDDI